MFIFGVLISFEQFFKMQRLPPNFLTNINELARESVWWDSKHS